MGFQERLSTFGPSRRHVLNELCTRGIARKVVREGDTVVDAGANEGYHTKELSRLVGDAGIVHAFEPNPDMWSNLLTIPNIRLWPFAVGDSIGIKNFYIPVENHFHQVGSLIDPRDFLGDVAMRVLSVPQVIFDSIVEVAGSRISFFKVDVERSEYNFFIGATETLKRDRPAIIFENCTKEIENHLNLLNYKVVSMAATGPRNLFANYLALPNEKSSEIEKIPLNTIEIDILLEYVESQYPDDVIEG